MVSAMVVLPRRSIDLVSSAFISSRLARTWARVSSGLGPLETGSGWKRAARGSAVMLRGPDPFGSFAPGTPPGAYCQNMRVRLMDSTRQASRKASFCALRDLYVTLLFGA